MRIKLKVKAKSTWSRQRRDIVLAAARFAAEEFNLLDFDATVVIKLVGTGEENYGSMVELEEQFQYLIHVHDCRSTKRLLDTVFHEMTHIKQSFFDGFCMGVDGGAVLWKHKEREFDKETDYWNAPWEVEARREAKKLVKKYTRTIN